MPQNGHGAVQAVIVLDTQTEALGVLPGTAFEPRHIDRVVGVSQFVDMFRCHEQVDDERLRLIPAHSSDASMADCDGL